LQLTVKVHRSIKFRTGEASEDQSSRGTEINQETDEQSDEIINAVKSREKVQIEFSGTHLAGLIEYLGLDRNTVGMIIQNGRLVTDPDRAELSPGDTVEFFPPMMGGGQVE